MGFFITDKIFLRDERDVMPAAELCPENVVLILPGVESFQGGTARRGG